MTSPVHVIKIGGSLLDLADLPKRIASLVCEPRTAIVVGGGAAADLARRWDQLHNVGETVGHWLAVRAMQLNTYMLAAVLDDARIVESVEQCGEAWRHGRIAMIDPVAWVTRFDEQIPRRWTFTSDSIAAHVAAMLDADCLLLAKSTLPPGECDLVRATELELVDPEFEDAAAGLVRIELVNLRAQSPVRRALR